MVINSLDFKIGLWARPDELDVSIAVTGSEVVPGSAVVRGSVPLYEMELVFEIKRGVPHYISVPLT